jgi:hypothetical protein
VHFCDFLALIGDRRFLDGEVLNQLAPKLCRETPGLCVDMLDLIVGPSTHYNQTRLQVRCSDAPSCCHTERRCVCVCVMRSGLPLRDARGHIGAKHAPLGTEHSAQRVQYVRLRASDVEPPLLRLAHPSRLRPFEDDRPHGLLQR